MKMRVGRCSTVGLILLLTIVSTVTADASVRTRTDSAPYAHTGEVEADFWVVQCGHATPTFVASFGYAAPYETVWFDVGPRETAATIKVLDGVSNQRIPAVVSYLRPDGTPAVTSFCGATSAPLRLAGDQTIEVNLLPGGVSDAGPWALTSGRVQAIFSRH